MGKNHQSQVPYYQWWNSGSSRCSTKENESERQKFHRAQKCPGNLKKFSVRFLSALVHACWPPLTFFLRLRSAKEGGRWTDIVAYLFRAPTIFHLRSFSSTLWLHIIFSTRVMQFPFLSKYFFCTFWAAGPLRNREKSCKIIKIEKFDNLKGFLPPAGQRPAGRAGRAGRNSFKILQNPILGWPGLLKPFMNLAHLAQSERAPGLLCGALSNWTPPPLDSH